ncbi:MAG TPA: metalloregulator ArsR/SmtB family transcription factor [Kineosporiaceae bacterium]|nr:metalloregulator ArsR/SmtB family transcription factor [Kineosporiaceae bacterium]
MFADAEHRLDVLDETEVDAAVTTLRMLADQTRLGILWALRDGELSVGDLGRQLRRPSPAVSQHLAKLRMGGLVSTRREGSQVFYRLRTTHVRQLVLDVLAHAQHLAAER